MPKRGTYEFCDWVVVYNGTRNMTCTRCEAEEEIKVPASRMKVLKQVEAFIAKHQECKQVVQRDFRTTRDDVL